RCNVCLSRANAALDQARLGRFECGHGAGVSRPAACLFGAVPGHRDRRESHLACPHANFRGRAAFWHLWLPRVSRRNRSSRPPAPPQDLVAAVLPGATPSAFVVDLSWSSNLETDLAGYRVYRSEQEGARGQLITPDLLPVPAVRDRSVALGHRYWYTVTAVDRAGNESGPSRPAAVDIAERPS